MIAKIFLFLLLLAISSISTANNILCAYDLNKDGALDDEGEIRSCIDGNCPLQRKACTTSTKTQYRQLADTYTRQCSKKFRRYSVHCSVLKCKKIKYYDWSWQAPVHQQQHTITDWQDSYPSLKENQADPASHINCTLTKGRENTFIEKNYSYTTNHRIETRQVPIDVCPYGKQYACRDFNGVKSCSNIACKKHSSTTSSIFNSSWHQDDGAKNAAGQCTDQTLLFSGKPSSCNLSGSKTAFKNCCVNKTGLTSTDSSGASLEEYGKMKAIYAVLAAAKAGVTAAAAGSSAATAMKTSLKASFDPTTLAISVGVYLVMDYLAKACGKQDMETAIMKDSGLCVEVGTYCSEEWKPFGCVQKTTGFCCFNSKIARIFHEQGRSQLTSFNNNSFGTAQSPDCRGYTPEEFSALDFDKIDLDEYVQDIQNKPNSVDLNAQITQKTQQLEQDL